MKIFKRTLSLVLAVLMLASMAIVMASAVDKTAPRTGTISYPSRDELTGDIIVDGEGNPVMKTTEASYGTRPVITDVVNSDPEIQVGTKTYRFYMPDSWYNDRNDNYDGKNLDSCSAGIYWWTTSYNSDDYKGDNAQGWPGFRILEQDPDDPHIFVAHVPEDAGTIIFDNTVDGGQSNQHPNYGFNYQTIDVMTKYVDVDDDPYGFYENGLESMDGMIYVVNPKDTTVNEFSGATTTKGDWFYYYGEGKYGLTPELGDTYFANGDFPSSLQISDTSIYNYLNDDPTYDVLCNAEPANLEVSTDDADIAKVSAVAANEGSEMWKSKVTVTGVKEGTTKITFKETLDDGEGNKTESYRTCAVENTYLKPKITTGPKTIYVGKTASIATVKLATSVTYSSSKTSVATVSNKGVVKGVAAGTATITITAKAGSVINKTTAKVTVKKMANPITVKAKTAKVSSKKKSTLAPAKYVAVTKAQGTLTYKKLKGDGKITIAKNGKMTVKKGLKKGKTYSVYVQVTAKGNAKYLAGTKKFTAKIKVS